MRLGGFVIFGDAAVGIERCLESLGEVCDEVLALHTGRDTTLRQRAARAGVRMEVEPWRGFGAARARAAGELGGCDYLFYLDADEWLEPPSRREILEWKRSSWGAPFYRLRLHDWILSAGGRKLFRSEWRRRLIRRDMAAWSERMLVHESLPGPRGVRLSASIEHHFGESPERLLEKWRDYAFLWAVQEITYGDRVGSRAGGGWGRYLLHLLRNALLKGALIRCGRDGIRYAAAVASYHRDKYRLLERLRAGGAPELLAAARGGRLQELFEMVAAGSHLRLYTKP